MSMPRRETGRSRSWSPRTTLAIFLALTALVRGWHLQLIPSVVFGMSTAVAMDAKFLLQHGIEHSPLSFPLLPTLPVLGMAGLLGTPPGQLLAGYVLAASMLQAFAFWQWMSSLPFSRQLRYFSCAAFLFLPLHNGYRGLFHVQSILAETMFLLIAAWYQRRSSSENVWTACGVFLLAACLPWTRSEYLLFVPLFLAIVSLLPTRRSDARSFFQRLRPAGIVCAGLAFGTITAMLFRNHYVHEFSLVPQDYTCWTFLDGMPPQWLAESDTSEYARRMVGIARFGHPAAYHHSLLAMILAHPGLTLEKFALNVPRWFWELGRTHQTLPGPAAALALVGLASLLRFPLRGRRIQLAVRIMSLIVITVPIIAIMLYPNYIRTAFDALCCLMALGALLSARMVHKVFRRIPLRWCFWGLAIGLCAGMEYLYFRSGAHHPDLPVYAKIAREIDLKLDSIDAGRVLLEPYEGCIDAGAVTRFQNQIAVRQYELTYGKSLTEPPNPIEIRRLYDTVLDQRIDTIAIWCDVTASDRFAELMESWQSEGFTPDSVQVIDGSPGPSWKLAICRRTRKTDL